MEELKRQLHALQANIDAHVGNGQVGNPCPTCGTHFTELAEGIDRVVSHEVRKRFTLDPEIEEGEIVDHGQNTQIS